jgi:hypothetical protein
LLPEAALLLEADRRMSWTDSTVFPPMIGVYYGVESAGVARSSLRLKRALVEMATWLEEGDWLC